MVGVRSTPTINSGEPLTQRPQTCKCSIFRFDTSDVTLENIMSSLSNFPNGDPYWLSVCKFLKKYCQVGEFVLGPEEFKDEFPDLIGYSSIDLLTLQKIDWAILHKGQVDRIGYCVAKQISCQLKPVFANEVFVIFSRRGGVFFVKSLIVARSKHMVSLRNILQELSLRNILQEYSYKQEQVLSKVFKDCMFQILSLKDIKAKSRQEIEFVSRLMAQSAYVSDGVALCRWLTRYMCYVDPEDYSIAPHGLLNGYWETWITKAIVDYLKPSHYCVDVGANCGYFSLVMADCVGSSGRVLSVEANPKLANLLDKTIAINGFSTYTKVVQKAVSNVTGTSVNLVVSGSNLGCASIVVEEINDAKSYVVETITIDDLVQSWPRVDFIKIDAEGAEPLIWDGMVHTLESNPNLSIVMEFSAPRYTEPRAFIEKIMAQGFLLRYIDFDSSLKEINADHLITMTSTGHCDLFLSRS